MIRLLGDPLAQSFNAAVWSGEGEGVALLSGDILLQSMSPAGILFTANPSHPLAHSGPI